MNDLERFTDTCFGVMEGLVKVNPMVFQTKKGLLPRSMEIHTKKGFLFAVRITDSCAWSLTFSNKGGWDEAMNGRDAASLRDVGYTACKAVDRAIRQMTTPFYLDRHGRMRVEPR